VINAAAEIDYKQKYEELFVMYQRQQFELDQLKRMIFGTKHERFVPSASPDQLALELGAEKNAAVAAATETIQYTRKKAEEKQKPHRLPLPAHLIREQVLIEPAEDISGLKKIGEEITEELEYTPCKLFVRQYVRAKYAKPQGEGIVIGELPVRPIEKGIAGPGLLAQTIIDKYCDHIPVYRQLERFKREGIHLSPSTVGDWIIATCTLLSPLYDALRKEVLASDYLQADETPIKVLDKDKKGSTHRGYHWVYHAPVKRLVLFDYRESRGREGPRDLLQNFTGHLQTDGYGVYDDFDKKNGITLLNCLAHARRKFEQALDNDRERASYALSKIQALYAIERDAKEQTLTRQEIAALRQQKAVPLLHEFKTWMEDTRYATTPKSPLGEAIGYALPRWHKLSLYTTNGHLHIDNNLIENAIRPVAIGRKNYLFAGSHEGARRAAMLYSFIGTCKMHKVNPFEWFRATLSTIPAHPANRLSELLPHNWRA
jgi:transposase